MTAVFTYFLLIALYLFTGRLLYKSRWPDGFLPPPEADTEIERLRRLGRRRVQPVPRRIRERNR